MNNPFVKRAERRPVGALLQTLLGGATGGAVGTGLNETLFSDASAGEQLARTGGTALEGAFLGNPVVRRFLARSLTKPETLKVTGNLAGKLKIPDSRVVRPIAGPGAATSAVSMPIFLPSLADQGETFRKGLDLVANQYGEDSLENEGFLAYMSRNLGEGLASAIPDRWINSLASQTTSTLKDLGNEGINSLKPVVNEVGKEMGKGLVPVGTGFAAGGLMGNLVARGLTDRSSKRETAEDERNWDKRNRLINMASLLGATVGGLGGYKLYEHNLQNS